MTKSVKRLPGWVVTSLVLFTLIGFFATQQIGVLAYKTLQVTFGLLLGYLADRAAFKHVVPMDEIIHDNLGAARILARAIIIMGVLIALAIGI